MLAAGGGRGQEGVSLAEHRRNKNLMIQPLHMLDKPSLEARGKIIYVCLGGLGLSLGLGSSPSLQMRGRGSPASPCGWEKKKTIGLSLPSASASTTGVRQRQVLLVCLRQVSAAGDHLNDCHRHTFILCVENDSQLLNVIARSLLSFDPPRSSCPSLLASPFDGHHAMPCPASLGRSERQVA